MTDTEKVLLCQNMIQDCWVDAVTESKTGRAEVLITAVVSVLDFAGEPDGD